MARNRMIKKEVLEAGYIITHQEGIYLKPLPLSILETLPRLEDNLQAMCKIGIDFPELCIGLLREVVSPLT